MDPCIAFATRLATDSLSSGLFYGEGRCNAAEIAFRPPHPRMAVDGTSSNVSCSIPNEWERTRRSVKTSTRFFHPPLLRRRQTIPTDFNRITSRARFRGYDCGVSIFNASRECDFYFGRCTLLLAHCKIYANARIHTARVPAIEARSAQKEREYLRNRHRGSNAPRSQAPLAPTMNGPRIFTFCGGSASRRGRRRQKELGEREGD